MTLKELPNKPADFVIEAGEWATVWMFTPKTEEDMDRFKRYRRTQIAEMRPYQPGVDDMTGISISEADREAYSPKRGDMIARNPKNHNDQWLVAAKYFADNFEPMDDDQ